MGTEMMVKMSSAEAAPHSGRWLMVGLLFAAIVVNYIDRTALSVVTVPLMDQLNISTTAMGGLLSGFFWTYTALQIPTGYIVDRFGIKWTYGLAFLVWSLSSAAVGLAQSFWQVLLFRLLLGAGQAVAQPASLTYVRRNFLVHEQGMATGIYLSGLMVGPAAGMYLGALLLDQVGWRSMFILTGLIPCIWLLPWFLLAPHDSRAAQPASQPRQGLPLKQIFTSRPVWGITIGAFFYAYYWYFVITWLPSYLRIGRGFSVMQMGAFTAVPLLAMAVISPIGGRFADYLIIKLDRPVWVRKIFVCCGFLLGSSSLLLLVVDSSAAVLAILILSLMGLGIATANYWALTQTISPAALIGRAIGYQNTIGNLAGICAPIITGLLVGESQNFQSSIIFAVVSLWVAAAAYYFLVNERDVDLLQTNLKGPRQPSE